MHRRFTIAAFFGLAIGLCAGNALACGESLYRIGKGVTYRSYTAPLPATILAVVTSPGDRTMVEHLAAAGHDVRVISNPLRVGNQLSSGEFDIVLAGYRQHDEIAVHASAGGVTYIPVASAGTAEVSLAQKEFAYSLSSEDGVKKYLRMIHRVLEKTRG